MITYWVGVFIALCINLTALYYHGKTEGKITLSNAFIAIILSLASLAEVGALIIICLVFLIAESDNIVIWKSKKK